MCCTYSVGQKDEDLITAQKELAAEIAHSKSLQAKSKSGTAPIAGAVGASNDSKLSKLTEELERQGRHLALNEDLTGFSVVGNKSEDEGETYNCILNDCLGVVGGKLFLPVQR